MTFFARWAAASSTRLPLSRSLRNASKNWGLVTFWLKLVASV